MNLLPYNITENLVKIYSDDLLANHTDQDDTNNSYNKFWTNPSDSIKKEVNSDLDRIHEYTNNFVSRFKNLMLSKEGQIRKQNINHYFGNWQKTVYLFYEFLNNNSDNNPMFFNLKTNDDKTHLFQIEKKPTKLQPGKYTIKMSYSHLIKKKMDKKEINDMDYMQIYFLLCLEISRQLVDNVLFFETPTAALHFQTPKQGKIMMKYAILGRLGHEFKNNLIKNNNSWVLTEDLKELKNQFYDLIKKMKIGKNIIYI